MHPELIKAAIRMRGTTPTALAAKLNVSPTTVFEVISGRTRSARIELAIASLVGHPIAALWPGRAKRINRRLKNSAAARGIAA